MDHSNIEAYINHKIMSQLKAGAILNYVIIGLNTVVGLLYTPYMLRMMGQSEYGLYSLVASVIAYLTVLDLGFGNAIIRYTAKFRAEGKQEEQYEMFGMFFVLYIGIGIIAFLAGLGLYYNVDKIFGDTMSAYELDRARILMLILIFNLAITFPMSIFSSVINAYERFVFPKTINIIRIILNTVVMICLLKMGYKAIAMAVVQTIFNILTLIINYIYCKREIQIKMYFRKFNWIFLKEVSIYSFWIFLNAIMDRVYWSTGQFVLGAYVGTISVAIFAVAIHLEAMYMQFSTAISNVFLPKVTAMVTNGNDEKVISDLFIKTGRVQFVIMLLILCGFIVFGKQFIILWAGADYAEAYPITLLFFIALLIPLIQNLGITILQARNQMKFRSLLYIVIAVIALLFQILLAKRWGGLGCAYAISGALLLGQGLIMNIYYQKIQHINILAFWMNIIKMAIAPVIVTIVAYYIVSDYTEPSWMSLAISIFSFCIVYLPITFIFSLNKYEKNLLLQPLNKLKKDKVKQL